LWKEIRFEDGKVVCKVPDNIEKVFSFSDAIREMNTYFYFDMSAWAKIYKRELFDNIRFPVGRLSEDFFIMYKLIALSQKSLIFQNLYIIICKEKAAFLEIKILIMILLQQQENRWSF